MADVSMKDGWGKITYIYVILYLTHLHIQTNNYVRAPFNHALYTVSFYNHFE